MGSIILLSDVRTPYDDDESRKVWQDDEENTLFGMISRSYGWDDPDPAA